MVAILDFLRKLKYMHLHIKFHPEKLKKAISSELPKRADVTKLSKPEILCDTWS